MELKTTKNKVERCILLERVKIQKQHIDKLKERRATKISKVVESIKSNADSGGKI